MKSTPCPKEGSVKPTSLCHRDLSGLFLNTAHNELSRQTRQCFVFFFVRGLLSPDLSYCKWSILLLILSTLDLENSLSLSFSFCSLIHQGLFSGLFCTLFSKQFVYFVFPCMTGFLNLRLVSIAPFRMIWLHLWSAESKWGRVLQLSSFPCWEGEASNLSMFHSSTSILPFQHLGQQLFPNLRWSRNL